MNVRYYGDKIFLRRLKLSDAGEIFKNIRTREILFYTYIPSPYKENYASEFIRESFKHWRKRTGYHFAICSCKTEKLIGVIGYQNLSWREKRAEVGYWVSKKYWGKGYMTEALQCGIEFGFKELKLNKIHAHTFAENVGSQKVLLKAGFKKEGHFREHYYRRKNWHDAHYYGLLKSEWEKLK